MALTMPSPNTASPSISLLRDSPRSPTSPKIPKDPTPHRQVHLITAQASRIRTDTRGPSSSSAGSSLGPPPSPYPQNIDPSPVDSNGTASTDATDIDDAPQEAAPPQTAESPRIDSASPLSPGTLGKLDTSVAEASRSDADPQSVIHVPQHFKVFNAATTSKKDAKVTESPSEQSDITVVSPQTPEAKQTVDPKESYISPSLNTDVPAQTADRSTPRAQTVQEVEAGWNCRKRQGRGMNLEGIPEGQTGDRPEDDELSSEDPEMQRNQRAEEEQNTQIIALRTTLTQCWTLCNTLANLSSGHRSRIFNFRGKSDVQEQAWRSCWRLCQNLYESRDDDHINMVLPTLELCRDFCQALFDARQRGDATADSVLRVSFELNNHLYNTHDMNLPSAFQERTLDFYLTLCHRLMKQRTSLPQETDSLLRACWSLAELLFSIRQNKREGKNEDEELLGSAVQACWDLCDLFREGWSQVRPDRERGTPRPNQGAFVQTQEQQAPMRSQSALSSRSSPPLNRPLSSQSYRDPKTFPPETPTTIFDDQDQEDADDATDDNIPNILVLGPEQANPSSSSASQASPQHHHNRWSSSSASSTASAPLSESSQRTSSTATAASSFPAEASLNRIRILILKAATNAGFQLRTAPTSPPSPNTTPSAHTLHHLQLQNQSLMAFVRALPSNAFGTHATQMALLDKYRKLVINWARVVESGSSSSSAAGSASNSSAGGGGCGGGGGGAKRDAMKGMVITPSEKRVTPAEVARAVQWMLRSEKNAWLKDLFRRVFGVAPEDAAGLTGAVMF